MKISFTDIEKELNSLKNRPKLIAEALDRQIAYTDTELSKRGVRSLNSSIHDAMLKYLAETNLEARDTGLLYFGNVGTGKTFAVKVIAAFRKYNFFTADHLVRIHEKNKDHFWEIIEKPDPIVIDDLDAEPIRVDYGSKYELMDQAIQKRYRMWQRDKTLTLLTTNLSGPKIAARYTDRIYSRLKQMCECINATGRNLREQK